MSNTPFEQTIYLKKSIILNSGEQILSTQELEPLGLSIGQLRYNKTISRFEGYHSPDGADLFGNRWRTLTADAATSSTLGTIKIGANLLMNPTTGVLSSIASGSGRSPQCVITISPISGAADFTNILTAITHDIGTSGGNYQDGSITSALGSAPSAEFPFILLLAPGVHSYSCGELILPPFVSLIGENPTSTILFCTDATIPNTNFITSGGNSLIANFTLQFGDDLSSSGATTLIYSTNTEYITLKHLTITDTSATDTAASGTCNLKLIHIANSTNITVEHCNMTIGQHYNTITAVNLSNTIATITNNTILNNNTTVALKYGVLLINCTYIDGYSGDPSILTTTELIGNTITMYTNEIQTFPVYVFNSYVTIRDCWLTAKSTLEMNTYSADDIIELAGSAIYIHSDTVFSAVDNAADEITLQHNPGTSDSIISIGLIQLDIFKSGSVLEITDTALASNNCLARAGVVTSNTVTLENYHLLETHLADMLPITIKQLFETRIHHCTLYGDNHPIEALGSSYISVTNCDIQGGAVHVPGNYLNMATSTILHVSNYNSSGGANDSSSGGYFKLISHAIAYISSLPQHSDINHNYIIKVAPGIYTESAGLIIPYNVSVIGHGKYTTTINFPLNDITCFRLHSQTTLSDLTINCNYLHNSTNTDTNIIILIEDDSHIILRDLILNSVCDSLHTRAIITSSASAIHLSHTTIRLDGGNGGGGIGASCIALLTQTTTQLTSEYITINVLSSTTPTGIKCTYTTPVTQTHTNLSILSYGIGIHFDNLDGGGGGSTDSSVFTIRSGELVAATTNIILDHYIIALFNNVNFNSEIDHGDLDFAGGNNLFCTDCYFILTVPTSPTTTTTYIPLNHFGRIEYTNSSYTSGDYAGTPIYSGTHNTITGVSSARSLSDCSYLTTYGTSTAENLTTGTHNTILGSLTGAEFTSGNYNTIIGAQSGAFTSNNVIIVGAYSLNNPSDNSDGSSGSNTIVIGSHSILYGGTLTATSNNIVCGNYAADSLNSSNTIIIGHHSFITSNCSNSIVIGTGAACTNYDNLISSTTGNNSIIIGTRSGTNNITDHAFIIGHEAGAHNHGIENTFIGHYTGVGAAADNSNITGGFNTIVGHGAGYSVEAGDRNTCLGAQAGTHFTNAAQNTLIGYAAGVELYEGNDNIFIGCNSAPECTFGSDNIIIGNNGAASLTSSLQNIVIGNYSGAALVSSDDGGRSVIIGHESGQSMELGGAVFIGYRAGRYATGATTLAIGYNSGVNFTGEYNTAVGQFSAGSAASSGTGSNNVFIGPYVGYNIDDGSRNIIVGSGDSIRSAGRQLSSGNDNTVIGYYAGKYLSNANDNTLVGSNAGASLSSGSGNLLLGAHAGFSLNTGSYNIMFGERAGYSQTSSNYNIHVGFEAGYNLVSGGYNINLGYTAGYSAVNTQHNLHLGYTAGYYSLADYNIFIGSNAGVNNTTGTRNICMGPNAGAGYNLNAQQTGDDNIFIGLNSGTSNESGSKNVCIGSNTNITAAGTTKNVYIGYNAGRDSTNSNNIFIGTTSDNSKGVGYLNTGEQNIFIGTNTGVNNTAAAHNIFLGTNAGSANTTGDANIYIGYNAGISASAATADHNICIGTDTLKLNEDGRENIILGRRAAQNCHTNVNQNIIIGREAGAFIAADDIIFIGSQAGRSNTTGVDNIFIGRQTGYHNELSSDNVIIGAGAGYMTASGGQNIMIGSHAGESTINGAANIFIGSNAAADNVTGAHNIIIGTDAVTSGECSNVIAIGYQTAGNNNSNDNIFIGTSAGSSNDSGESIICIGTGAGFTNSSGSNKINIGFHAGYNHTNSDLIAIGLLAGYFNISGLSNILLGNRAGYELNADNNILIGHDAGRGATSATGSNNIGVGSSTLYNLLTSEYNIAFGSEALYSMSTGVQNIAIGTHAGFSNTTGYENIIIGTDAGYYPDHVFRNIFIGNNAGRGSSSFVYPEIGASICHLNIGIGLDSLRNVTTGGLNTCLGPFSGTSITVGLQNVCLGHASGFSLTDGGDNINLGTSAGYAAIIANNNVNIGTHAGELTESNENIKIGTRAGAYHRTGEHNLYIGYEAGIGDSSSTGIQNNNIGIGNQSLYNITNADYNICLGVNSGRNLSTGGTHLLIGYNAGFSANVCVGSICIGNSAGYSNTANGGINIGSSAGYNNITGEHNINIGEESGYSSSATSYNINIGYHSGRNMDAGDNIFIGYLAGEGGTPGALGSTNIGIGRQALTALDTGEHNTCIGASAGTAISTGAYNTNIGTNAGATNLSGEGNTNIGYRTGADNTGEYNLNIGASAGANTTLSNNCVNIGYQCGLNSSGGDGNLFIGNHCGRDSVGGNNLYLCDNAGYANTGNGNILIQVGGNLAATTFENNLVISSTANAAGLPLLYGDLATNTLYINTLSNIGSLSTQTALVVNGTARAGGFTSFTGLHKVLLANSDTNEPILGQILSANNCTSRADPLNPVITCHISSRAMDSTVYCVYFYNELNSCTNVREYYGAGVGEGCMLITNITGDAENGDYITSSVIAGYGCKQRDDILHNYTVAKLLESPMWGDTTDTIEYNGILYKSTLAACVFLCG